MALTDAPSRLLPLAEELLDNRYARDNLREGAEKLRDAYGRARRRRVKPSRDRKLRRQFEAAITALDEGTAALASGRKKPKRTGRKVVLTALAVTAAGAAAAFAFAVCLLSVMVAWSPLLDFRVTVCVAAAADETDQRPTAARARARETRIAVRAARPSSRFKVSLWPSG